MSFQFNEEDTDSIMAIFDVTNVTTHKFRLDAQSVASSNAVACSSDETVTGVTVFRVGDT